MRLSSMGDGEHDTACFNPRTRKGCDPIAVLCLTELSGFNPRTRKGCDLTIGSV